MSLSRKLRDLMLMHLGEAGNRCFSVANELQMDCGDRFAWQVHIADTAKKLRAAGDALDALVTAGQPTTEEKRAVEKAKARQRMAASVNAELEAKRDTRRR